MAYDQVKIGIIGAGTNTITRHIPELLSINGVHIVGVCNRSHDSSKNVADRFGISSVYDRWTDMVEDPQIDAILIGTWPYMHCPVTVAALAEGKHVLCEARMAMNLAESRAMRDASRRNPSSIAQLVPAPNTLRVDTMVRRLIASGFPGDIVSIEVNDSTGFPNWSAPLHWREDAELSGLNIMTLGIWYECVMRWVGEASHVQAMSQTVVKKRRDSLGTVSSVRIPDHIEVTAKMHCGAMAHYTISRVCGFAGPASITIYGTDGVIRFSQDILEAGKRDDNLSVVNIPDELEGTWRVEKEFISAIRGQERVSLTTFDTGLRYMAFTEAVAESLTTGNTVAVPQT